MRWVFITLFVLVTSSLQAKVLVSQIDCEDRIFDYAVGYFNDSSHPVWFIQQWDSVKNLPKNDLNRWLSINKDRLYVGDGYSQRLQRLKQWNKKNQSLILKYNSPANRNLKCNLEIVIFGIITSKDTEALKAILKNFSVKPNIHAQLASEGGEIYAAMEIGEILRDHFALVNVGIWPKTGELILEKYKNYIETGESVKAGDAKLAYNAYKNREACFSACSLIYVSGVSRRIATKVGLHQHFLTKDYLQTLSMADGIQFMQQATKDLQTYLTRMGIPSGFYDLAVSIPKDDFILLGDKEMLKVMPFVQPEFAAVVPQKVAEAQAAMNTVIVEVAKELDVEVSLKNFMDYVDKKRISNPDLYLWNKYNAYHINSSLDSQRFHRSR